MLVDPQSRKLFVMNRVGALVWEGVLRGADAEAIAGEITARFQVDAERARADVDRYFETLLAAGLALVDEVSPR